jgi:hypothetical protein
MIMPVIILKNRFLGGERNCYLTSYTGNSRRKFRLDWSQTDGGGPVYIAQSVGNSELTIYVHLVNTNQSSTLTNKVHHKMYKRILMTEVLISDPFACARLAFSGADDNGASVSGSSLPMKNGREQGMAACDQPVTEASPLNSSSKSLPPRRRILGNRLLWQRQSQISWKWIRATPQERKWVMEEFRGKKGKC